MIFEGSCDTEHWSNDAKNLALHHRHKLHFKIEKKIMFHSIAAFNVFLSK